MLYCIKCINRGNVMFDWNAEQYQKFIAERTQPAIDLVNRIDREPQTVFDLGCGPGNSTAILFQRFPQANILGGDSSEDMLIQARENHPQLKYVRFDAQSDFERLNSAFDLIFSNACIQWVPNHEKLLQDMLDSLADNGQLAVQIPLTDKVLMEELINQLINQHSWSAKMSQSSFYHTLEVKDYANILAAKSSNYSLWETTYFHVMPSHQSILDWYQGTGLRPHLSQLSSREQQLFCQELLMMIEEAYPVQKNGEILFPFPRLFFIANK
ncbi:methyltransferase domain-containing protein [Streptococcus dentiloxodontae]